MPLQRRGTHRRRSLAEPDEMDRGLRGAHRSTLIERLPDGAGGMKRGDRVVEQGLEEGAGVSDWHVGEHSPPTRLRQRHV
jgi:hypothetical protein